MDDIKYRGLFLQEADDGGAGGGGEEESQGMSVFEGDTSAPPSREPDSGGREAPPTRAEPSATVDARQLAHEFGSVIGQHFQPPQKEMSVEEAKRLLNVWEPTPEWMAKFDNLETRTPALAELRDGLIKHADTIAQYRMREMMDGMQKTYAPVLHYMQTQEARAGEWRFKQAFPTLAHDNMRPLLFAVSQNLLQQGVPFRSEDELFTAIANGVEAVIKVNNPEFSLGNGSGSPAPVQHKQGRPTATAGSIPVTTPGSGGGGGSARSGQGPPRPRGLAIFE
jgi:hypothetical protein